MVSAPLCACGRPGPFAYGLHAYMAKRSIPDPIEDGVWQNHRIEESQTRQSVLPETPIPSTQSNCLSLRNLWSPLLRAVRSVQSAPTAQDLDPIVTSNWLATAEFPPSSTPQKMTTTYLGSSDLMVDGRLTSRLRLRSSIGYRLQHG